MDKLYFTWKFCCWNVNILQEFCTWRLNLSINDNFTTEIFAQLKVAAMCYQPFPPPIATFSLHASSKTRSSKEAFRRHLVEYSGATHHIQLIFLQSPHGRSGTFYTSHSKYWIEKVLAKFNMEIERKRKRNCSLGKFYLPLTTLLCLWAEGIHKFSSIHA